LENLSPVSWVPSGIFALLALYFLQKAVRPRARQSWGWGRTGEAAPISRTGYGVLGVTFLDIAVMLAWAPGPPPVSLIVLFLACFLAAMVVGFLDTHRYRRKREAELSRKS
jgi:Flp pilus assembly protein TadB